jgi:type IV pilus assembly protein PilC
MPVFEWVGTSQQGDVKKGILSAPSTEQLRALVRKDGIFLTHAAERAGMPANAHHGLHRRVKRAQIGIFTRQLSTMINSGLPLVQSLEALSTQFENATLRGITAAMKEKIEGGARFAETLQDYPNCFDELYVNLVVAGEEGGMLDTVLMRLAHYIEKTEKLRRKVKTALIYPSSIVVVAIGVVLVLLLFVIPVFERMFAGFGKTLPIPTQIVIGLSTFVKAGIFYIAATAATGAIGLKKYYGTDNGRRTIDRMVLKIPVIGLLLQKASVARVTRTLGTLLTSGVSILESLTIVAKTAGNRIIEESLITARADISSGKSISDPLKESAVFPPMTIQMIQVGEATGALDTMLNKIADFYEEDVDNMVTNLTSLLEPAIMVVLGVVLGGLIFAMYLPIFQLGTVVG